ncbi:MAG: hypothetical protein JOZ17_13495 [Acetobacteraceae bacterium]|nr:hypothetical protein [Acetobacteraceae bacterium]
MLSRSHLVSLATAAKKQGEVDLILRYNPVVRRKVSRLIAAFERADLHERRKLTDLLASRAIERARQTRYGRGRSSDYLDWPLLNKDRLRDAPDDFACRGSLRIPAATGGTGGLPIKLWRSPASAAAEQVFLDHIIRPYGVSWASARIASLRGDVIKDTRDWSPPFGIETHRGRRLVLSSPHLTRTTVPWFAERLSSFRPDILWAWPTVASNLLGLLQQTKTKLNVPLVLASSERLEPQTHAAMQGEWGATVIDYYGQAERVCFAVSSKAGEFWFNPAYGRVELTFSEADEIVDGCRYVAIVATGFWNRAMPLVRYETGDGAIVPANASESDLEAISLGLQPFAGIAGRSDEFLIAPTGERISGLNQLPREVDHLLQLQIVQAAPDDVIIRALVRPSFGAPEQARLEANARAKIPDSMAIRLELVDHLETSSRGKTPFVIRNGEMRAWPGFNGGTHH